MDVNENLQFHTYSTFTTKADWKFTRKNHLYLVVGILDQSRQTMLNETIVFQTQMFSAGLVTHVSLSSYFYAPAYQYDIIRRRRGHLGIAVQLNLSNSKGTIRAAEQVTADGVRHAAQSGQGSLLVPLPVLGPDFRFYLTRRFFVDGNVHGMYFGGYGNFVSSRATAGFAVTKQIHLTAGYALAQHLEINNKANTRIGVRLNQRGPLAGLEVSF